ncbi:MinD/ParA family ATP-binding protein [Actinomadura violacea]|uniref:CobQ/CobB/MinD/ParA nucleotide binding domain-containing protein n=1 Tax=Actinomadura violacea TaxID=2819934 RepID=A0ABS3S8C1_9ACTN|nr:MinD/ParA family protein [Actinomadura violacea]MBO2465259.1 hypothetical protein [Actinomadura violacea]
MPDLGWDGHDADPYPMAAELVGDVPHGDPLWRRIGRGAVHAFLPTGDVRSVAEQAASIQRPIITGRRIAVAGMRGGAGKSTVTALLATVFAHYRRDRVLALDVDPDFGSLALRLGAARRHAVGDLTMANGFRSFDEAEPFLVRVGERLWTLAGNHGNIGDAPLSAEIYRDRAMPLTRFFGITLVDCDSGITGPLSRHVLEGSHVQILVAPATPDGARSVGRELDWLQSAGMQERLHRTVVVFTVKAPYGRRYLDLEGASAILADVGVACVRLDYDRHLASGAPLDPQRLAHNTRTTAIRLAALLLDRAVPSEP